MRFSDYIKFLFRSAHNTYYTRYYLSPEKHTEHKYNQTIHLLHFRYKANERNNFFCCFILHSFFFAVVLSVCSICLLRTLARSWSSWIRNENQVEQEKILKNMYALFTSSNESLMLLASILFIQPVRMHTDGEGTTTSTTMIMIEKLHN